MQAYDALQVLDLFPEGVVRVACSLQLCLQTLDLLTVCLLVVLYCPVELQHMDTARHSGRSGRMCLRQAC